MIYLTENKIDVNYLLDFVQHEEAGAVDIFIGTVRSKTSDKKVVRLEYEAYDTMAIKKIQEIVSQATQQWNILKYAVVHRKGILQIGEAAVVIAVATPHRQAAFEACKYIIDTIKANVPIWKKEVYENGEIWVAAHP
ncbi:molybdenum cofactor biosynthesis protein MoaE [Thermoflexibacter ruber]|uniref:Molybdopterin synthase catalytic subunit n=1 Tax=Thermoflexibacter ruber TaxID=1003 RepID=A0A1I2AIG7_9BACT|nr:molybdenum cofactor biosynthesis protein MoaE [Thermoflexibacter ruber]SFE42743.1 molybdopterin synthase subunit MoaE [Thermoflexibacter ruber]